MLVPTMELSPATLATGLQGQAAAIGRSQTNEGVRKVENGDRAEADASFERPPNAAQAKATASKPPFVGGARDALGANEQKSGQQTLGRNVNITFDKSSGRLIIEIINPRSGEVVDRLPPETLRERLAKDHPGERAVVFDKTV